MRPGQIRVFDGLRITTEHMNHFQGSLHSAIQDIREILGLGKVHEGFEVSIVDAETIVVQPGLAFDFEKNRLRCDEPRTVKVSLEPDQEAAFVCVKYDQIEDGQTEGHFTLIWDSCSIVLRPTMPVEKDNVVPIAKLIKTEDGKLEVVDLVRLPAQVSETRVDESANAMETAKTPETSVTEETEKSAPTPVEEAGPVPAPVEEAPPAPTSVEAPTPTSVGEAVPPKVTSSPSPVTAAEVTATAGSWKLKFQQGIVRFSDAGTEPYLSPMLPELLRKKLAGNQTANGELMFTVAKAEVPIEVAVSSLTCQSVITARLKLAAPSGDEAAPEATPPTELNLQSTSAGEVTFTDGLISQFGVSTIQRVSSELTERGIAHLPFSAQIGATDGKGGLFEMWKPLQLLIRVDSVSETSIIFVCNLLWIGGATEEIIRTIEEQKPDLSWTSQVAWKAAGVTLQ